MSGQLYNLIMASMPSFYSGDQGEFTIPKDRFLEYTEDPIKEQFQSLDQDAINKLKNLPTIFAVEDEVVDAKIGKITDIKANSNNLRVKYRFDKDHYPLTRGILKEHQQKLGIDDFEFHRGHWAVKECDISDFYEEYLKSLTGIAHKLKNTDKKVQLIYAFNGTGKTRLSLELKKLIAPKLQDVEDLFEEEDLFEIGNTRRKFIYYNAFTEDLFYWDNDLEGDAEPKLKIQPNTFTDWVMTFLKDQGQDQNIGANFQRYSNSKIIPLFNEEYKYKEIDPNGKEVEIKVPAFSEITFSKLNTQPQEMPTTLGERVAHIKISKGEESNFIWSIFYTLLNQVVDILNVVDPEERETDQFNELKYVFIDDPVSSLDENHLIELAVNVARLIKDAPDHLKFIITTHSPFFYNVLYSQLGINSGYILSRFNEDEYALEEKKGGSNKAFSYHLHIKGLIEQAIKENASQRYHFTLLRNLYEKTGAFLGYKDWVDLLDTVEGNKKSYIALMNSLSHSKLSNEEITELTPPQQQTVKLLLDNLDQYGSWYKEDENAATN